MKGVQVLIPANLSFFFSPQLSSTICSLGKGPPLSPLPPLPEERGKRGRREGNRRVLHSLDRVEGRACTRVCNAEVLFAGKYVGNVGGRAIIAC